MKPNVKLFPPCKLLLLLSLMGDAETPRCPAAECAFHPGGDGLELRRTSGGRATRFGAEVDGKMAADLGWLVPPFQHHPGPSRVAAGVPQTPSSVSLSLLAFLVTLDLSFFANL